MELRLDGSQINLATRSRPNTPVVNYPPTPKRPASAATGNHSARILFQHLSNKRPYSADCKLLRRYNAIKTKYNLSAESINSRINNLDNRITKATSSTDVLQLLLDEPIETNYKLIGKSDKVPLNQKEKLKLMDKQFDEIEEIIEEDTEPENQLNGIDKRPLVQSSTFSKNPINTSMSNAFKERSTSGSHRNQLPPLSSSTPNYSKRLVADLPGRVSFNRNDVYELDFSDVSDDGDFNRDRHSNAIKKNVHFDEHLKIAPSPTCETVTSNSVQSTSPENNMTASSTDEKHYFGSRSSSTNSSHDFYFKSPRLNQNSTEDKSMQIIEDYKREIETINQNRELELKLTQHSRDRYTQDVKKETDYQMKTNNQLDDFQTITLSDPNTTSDLESKKHSGGIELIEKFYEVCRTDSMTAMTSNDLSYSVENDNRKLENNLSQITNTDYMVSNKEEIGILSVNPNNNVIQNYLEATNQDLPEKRLNLKAGRIKPKEKTKKVKTNVVKIRPSNQTTSKLKKAKSTGCIRENSIINEFHLDDVDTWMSVQDDSVDGVSLSNRQSSNNVSKAVMSGRGSNVQWSQETSQDEGNFSLEDQIDSSNEDSTYNEIVSMIKEIENNKKQDSKDYRMLKEETEFHLKGLNESSTSLHNEDMGNDKLKEMLSYLDQLDSNCDKTIEEVKMMKLPDSARSEIDFTAEPYDFIEDVPKMADLIMLPNYQLARRVVALSLRANELSNAIQLSKEHVTTVRNEKQKTIRMEKQTAQQRLKEQKKHYESIIGRHQGFIEQLIKDKTGLCDKVSSLTRRTESQNQAWEHKLKAEVARVKEITLAGEKIRRERWVRENTKKIKELTVKGLEMEINKMTSNHQKEITELKRIHQQELLDTAEEARLKYERNEKTIRDSLTEDREAAIEKERAIIRERYERQIEMEQNSFEEQKMRLINEFAKERERLQMDAKEKDHDIEVKKEQWLNERNDVVEQLKREFKEKFRLQENKHQSDLASVREQYETDFNIWRREHENASRLREVEKENSIRHQCRLERDKQIDAIVAKVDAEALKTQHDYEQKITRLKEKYEAELKQMETTESMERQKYLDTRNRLAETEATVSNLRATIKQLELQLDHSQKMCNEFLGEKETMKLDARNEIHQEIVTIRKERDEEIQKIYMRVQNTIEKKDAAMDMLQKENNTLKDRCFKLETIVRQQRKDYCMK